MEFRKATRLKAETLVPKIVASNPALKPDEVRARTRSVVLDCFQDVMAEHYQGDYLAQIVRTIAQARTANVEEGKQAVLETSRATADFIRAQLHRQMGKAKAAGTALLPPGVEKRK